MKRLLRCPRRLALMISEGIDEIHDGGDVSTESRDLASEDVERFGVMKVRF